MSFGMVFVACLWKLENGCDFNGQFVSKKVNKEILEKHFNRVVR